MTEEAIGELHSLTCRYDQWIKSFAEDEARRLEAYGDMFYNRIEEFK